MKELNLHVPNVEIMQIISGIDSQNNRFGILVNILFISPSNGSLKTLTVNKLFSFSEPNHVNGLHVFSRALQRTGNRFSTSATVRSDAVLREGQALFVVDNSEIRSIFLLHSSSSDPPTLISLRTSQSADCLK